MDEGLKYVPQSNADAICGLDYATGNLKDYRHLSDSAVAVSIKIIVHLIGDMHCPEYAAMPLIETQMLYAGYRLAYVLNSLFK